jgi:hypothetical protein
VASRVRRQYGDGNFRYPVCGTVWLQSHRNLQPAQFRCTLPSYDAIFSPLKMINTLSHSSSNPSVRRRLSTTTTQTAARRSTNTQATASASSSTASPKETRRRFAQKACPPTAARSPLSYPPPKRTRGPMSPTTYALYPRDPKSSFNHPGLLFTHLSY